MSPSALEYLRAMELQTAAATDTDKTAAEELLDYLKGREDISYFVVYDDPNSSLITIPNRRKMIKKTVTKIGGVSMEKDEVIDVDKEIAKYAEDKRNDLKLHNGSKILLLLAWNTDEERRMFSLFPELLVADLTEGTNKSQRSLALLVEKDGNNETFTALQ